MKIETLIEELQKLKEEGYTEVMIKKTKYYEEIEDLMISEYGTVIIN